MDIRSHSGKSRHGFTLASCCDQNNFFIRIIFYLVNFYQSIFRNTKISEFRSNGNDIDHASSFYDYLPSIMICRIDNLLYTVYIGCKGRYQNTVVRMFTEDRIKGFANSTLRLGKSRTFCIGTVTHQSQYAFFPNLTKTLQVNGISVYRCVIYFKISGMDNDSCAGIDCQSCRILNTVVCPNKLYTEAAKINMLTVFYDFSFYFRKHVMLF